MIHLPALDDFELAPFFQSVLSSVYSQSVSIRDGEAAVSLNNPIPMAFTGFDAK
jgi:hypothetical protein